MTKERGGLDGILKRSQSIYLHMIVITNKQMKRKMILFMIFIFSDQWVTALIHQAKPFIRVSVYFVVLDLVFVTQRQYEC